MEVIYKTFNGTARTDLILRGERANLLKFDQSHILGEVLKVTPVHNLTNRLIDLYIVFNNKEVTVIEEVTEYNVKGEHGEYKGSCELYLLPPTTSTKRSCMESRTGTTFLSLSGINKVLQ